MALHVRPSRCVTVEDKVAGFGDLVAGKAGVVHRLVGGFAVVKVSNGSINALSLKHQKSNAISKLGSMLATRRSAWRSERSVVRSAKDWSAKSISSNARWNRNRFRAVRSPEPVDCGGPRRHGGERRVFAGNAGKETQNSVSAADRVEGLQRVCRRHPNTARHLWPEFGQTLAYRPMSLRPEMQRQADGLDRCDLGGADALNVGDTGTGGDAVEMYGGAPQSAMPQPNFVPVMPSTSRNTPRPFAHPRRIGRHHHYLALRRAHARAPLT
jgi:hypothetical protein